MGTCKDGLEIHRGDPCYPSCVAELPQAPPVLYVRGDVAALALPSLSIVGSRRATPYGASICELAAGIAVESGLCVVSGGARGCDQAAGWGALDAGGRHVVVLGTGADVVYPSTARALVERVIESGGCVISIEPWGTPPQRWAFPKRNRVIAALSSATFVAEAGLPSGTFSTAEAANELGREVLAAPGSIFSPESRGSNYLIANGACCIADEEALEVAISRIYGTLRFCRRDARGNGNLKGSERRALDMIVASPLRVEELAGHLGIDGVSCLTLVSSLEIQGLVVRLPDGRISPSKSALHALTRLGHNG